MPLNNKLIMTGNFSFEYFVFFAMEKGNNHRVHREIKRKRDMSKLSILSELWDFLKVRKKWWLLPIIFFLILLGGLIIITQGSALAPFIYAIF